MSIALGMKLRIGRITSALASVITTNLQAWHKFTATAWSGSDRLPDSSPVGTNTAALYTGRGLDFDGVNDVVTVGATGVTVKTVVFYANPDTTTQSFMQLQSSGAVRIQIASGTLSATGFTSPTLYVNGAASSSVSASSWQMIAVTSATGVSASNVLLGQQNTTFYSGSLSNVKFFSTELNSTQIAELYANPEQALPTGSVAGDLVGWWPMTEGGASLHALDGSSNYKIGVISGATYVSGQPSPVPQLAIQGRSLPLLFNGSDTRVSATLAAGGTTITMAGHVMGTISERRAAFGCGNTTAGNCAYLQTEYTSNTPYVTNNASTLYAATSLTLGKLHHVAFSINGTAVKIYVDGALSNSGTFATTLNLTTLSAFVGSNFFANTNATWKGLVQTMAIWNTELTAGEISSLYSGTSPATIQAANLQNYLINYGDTNANWLKVAGAGSNGTVTGTGAVFTLQSGINIGNNILGYPLQHSASGAFLANKTEYASIADAATLDITTTISLEGWVNPFTVSTAQTIIGKNGSYALGITSAGKPVFTKWTSAASTATATTTTTVTVNTWTHIAATYDGTNVKIYINGALNTTTAVSGAMDATSAAVLLGALTTSTQMFSGIVDSAKIYSSALTAGEVATNYAAEVSTHQ